MEQIVAIRIQFRPEHPTTISQCQLFLFAERVYVHSVPAGSDVDVGPVCPAYILNTTYVYTYI